MLWMDVTECFNLSRCLVWTLDIFRESVENRSEPVNQKALVDCNILVDFVPDDYKRPTPLTLQPHQNPLYPPTHVRYLWTQLLPRVSLYAALCSGCKKLSQTHGEIIKTLRGQGLR